MNAPGTTPRWPKGPFPERYRFAMVEARLVDAWAEPRRAALLVELESGGLTALGPEDPWVRLFAWPDDRDAAELARIRLRAREAGATAFVWCAPRKERDVARSHGVIGLVPSAEPAEAISAIGVAGPIHGIGLPALVRFLVTLRSFGRFEIEAMGEDRLELSLVPKDEVALQRVAERVLHLCPPLARTSSADAVAHGIRESGRLVMDWA